MLLFADAFGIDGPPALFIDLFNRPNTTSFGPSWTTTLSGSGNAGVVDAKGYLTTNTGAYAAGAVAYASAMPAVVDQEIYIETTFDTAISESYTQIAARVQNVTDISGSDASTGYTIVFMRQTGEVQFQRPGVALGKFTIVSGGFPANTTWALRFYLKGSALKWRVWQTGTTEPTAWNQEITDTTWAAAGRVMLSAQNGSDGLVKTSRFNDFRVNEFTQPVALPYTENFSGTDGQTWNQYRPALWGQVVGSSGYKIQALIQSGQGRLTSTYNGLQTPNGYIFANGLNVSSLDQTFIVRDVVVGAVNQYFFFGVGSTSANATTSTPFSSYYGRMYISANTITYSIRRKDASGNVTTVNELQMAYSTSAPFRTRLQYNATTGLVRLKVWLNSVAEPSTWDISGTIPTGITGSPFFSYSLDSSSDPTMYMSLDELVYTDPTAAVVGSTGQAKVYLSSSFVAKPVKVWNGTSWTIKPVKVWNGSTWKITQY